MSALRFATPGQLLICVILFFMPWIEIQCPMPDLGNPNIFGPAGGEPPKKASTKDMKYTSLLTQTGLQIATGEYTMTDPTVRKLMEQAKDAGKQAGAEQKEDKIKKAPLLFLYPIAAIAGIVASFVMPGGGPRKAMLVICCALALLAIGGQAAMGFPVEKDIKEQQAKDQKQGGAVAIEGDGFKTVYKFPFYLALILAFGGIMTAAIEPEGVGKKRLVQQPYDFEDDLEEALPADSEPPTGQK